MPFLEHESETRSAAGGEEELCATRTLTPTFAGLDRLRAATSGVQQGASHGMPVPRCDGGTEAVDDDDYVLPDDGDEGGTAEPDDLDEENGDVEVETDSEQVDQEEEEEQEHEEEERDPEDGDDSLDD
jgi:hypothetical protein